MSGKIFDILNNREKINKIFFSNQKENVEKSNFEDILKSKKVIRDNKDIYNLYREKINKDDLKKWWEERKGLPYKTILIKDELFSTKIHNAKDLIEFCKDQSSEDKKKILKTFLEIKELIEKDNKTLIEKISQEELEKRKRDVFNFNRIYTESIDYDPNDNEDLKRGYEESYRNNLKEIRKIDSLIEVLMNNDINEISIETKKTNPFFDDDDLEI